MSTYFYAFLCANHAASCANHAASQLGAPKEPPFTTTATPTTTALPSPPPPLYPAFYAPAPKDILPDLKFPGDFKFGVASASYQVEGATKKEGKGPTMWDFISHVPFVIADGTNGMGLRSFLRKRLNSGRGHRRLALLPVQGGRRASCCPGTECALILVGSLSVSPWRHR